MRVSTMEMTTKMLKNLNSMKKRNTELASPAAVLSSQNPLLEKKLTQHNSTFTSKVNSNHMLKSF